MLRLLLILAVLPSFALAAARVPSGFVSLFDGKTLNGWEGNPALWSVVDNAITGRTSAEAPLKSNTFLIWKGGETRNFELRVRFRFLNNNEKKTANSGVQYRSRVVDPAGWVVGGYQGDFDAAGRYVGMLYEEKGRGIIAKPGERVRLVAPPAGAKTKPEVVGATAPAEKVAAAFKPADWNDLVIIAEGNHLRHYLNGTMTADVTDLDAEKGAAAGVLALQVHTGPPMTVQFQSILLKKLP